MSNEEVICSGCNAVVHWSEADCNSESAGADWLCSDCRDAAELEVFRKREEHVRDLLSLTSEALSKLESLRGHVREGLVSGLRKALVAVRDFKVTP